jgi:hypothetical protein
MKTFLLFIMFFAFLQSAFLEVNLVLVFLIARSLVMDERSNLYLAFAGGLAVSFLTQVNLGYWPLVFLFVSKISSAAKHLPFSLGPLMILIIGGVQVLLVSFISLAVLGLKIEIWHIILESLLTVPAFYIVKAWEERFVVKREIKLKI